TCIKAGMTAIDGEAAAPHLRKLEEELKLERARALAWSRRSGMVSENPALARGVGAGNRFDARCRFRSHRSRCSHRSILDSSGLYIRRVRCHEPADGRSFYASLH